jgi:hypothetical protein
MPANADFRHDLANRRIVVTRGALESGLCHAPCPWPRPGATGLLQRLRVRPHRELSNGKAYEANIANFMDLVDAAKITLA